MTGFGCQANVPVLSAKHLYAPPIDSQLEMLLSGIFVQMPSKVAGMLTVQGPVFSRK
jgi:hypothetical protein